MSIRHAILGSLARRPASGYDLLQLFDRKLNFIWWASHGAVYTELQRLEAAGLIEAGSSGARNRQEYAVTDAGLEELRSWLTSDLARRPRDELVLRVLSLWALPQEQAIEVFENIAAQHEQRLAHYQQVEADRGTESATPEELFELIALRAGVHNEQAMLAWARESIERLAPEAAHRR